MTEHNKKLTQPEHLTPSSQAAQPLPDAAVQPPEAANPEAASSPLSAPSSVPVGPLAPEAGMSVPEATHEVGPAPEGPRDWRSHIFFFWFSIAGTVGTLFGVALSVYLYQASQIKPLLTFGVHPLKTELQRPDYEKELGFTYKGKPLDSESITAVQVSIWNAGTRSIRDSDVLDPFRLVMPDRAAILSVRVKKTSRPVCGFERLDNQEDYKSGTCRLKWLILEPSDGAVLQIIYAGGARHDPTLKGAVEGQRAGTVVEEYNLTGDRTTIIRSKISMAHFGPVLILLSVAVLLAFLANRIHAKTAAAQKLAEEKTQTEKRLAELRKRPVPWPPASRISMMAALVLVLGALWLLLSGSSPGPPFGW